eukprot:TRINITY_DN18134_c0_g1_i1.p1 TRINITY_DN18134_c0_g1~~TRINITY_DN18134_c0_g1_i1.p1  ORF type:complete len:101 (-),score=29.34 TRINITY_DN18134_c0_g1_i1:89-391(-)
MTQTDLEAQGELGQSRQSLGSGTGSVVSLEEKRSITCRDIKLIMPTVLILLFTIFIMVTVIPYAFSSVIKQLKGLWALEEHLAAQAEKEAMEVQMTTSTE